MTVSRAARSLAVAALLALATPLAPFAQQPQGAPPERIPFKQDEGEFGALMWRSILVTAGLVVVALGAIYVMRRYNFMPQAARAPAEGAARVVQTVRLGPRASLHVVQFEGRRVLIGQTDRELRLITSAAAESAPETREGG
jgi:flagellar biogenesis protein FliO